MNKIVTLVLTIFLIASFLDAKKADRAVKVVAHDTSESVSFKKSPKKEAKNVTSGKKAVAEKVLPKNLISVNKIALMVYTDEDPIIITQHEINRKSLDGRARTKDEVLFEFVAHHEATELYKMPAEDERVDKHLASIRELHGVTDEQIKQLFREQGYSFEEGKEALRRSYAIEDLLHRLINDRLMVPEKDIVAFYEKNPVVTPAEFRVKKGFIQHDAFTQEERTALQEDGLYQERVEWRDPYWITLDEIADSKKFIADMKPGEIRILPVDGGYEIVTLLKRKKEQIKSLKERRREITDELKFPQQCEMRATFEKELLAKYEVVDFT